MRGEQRSCHLQSLLFCTRGVRCRVVQNIPTKVVKVVKDMATKDHCPWCAIFDFFGRYDSYLSPLFLHYIPYLILPNQIFSFDNRDITHDEYFLRFFNHLSVYMGYPTYPLKLLGVPGIFRVPYVPT